MIYRVREWDDPILREPAGYVETIDHQSHKIIDNMLESMYTIGAVGLAANQCGIPLRIMLVGNVSGIGPPLICINPQITNRTKDSIVNVEGCFSLPGVYGNVERPKYITLKYKNQSGSLVMQNLDHRDWVSIIAQHELDHLDGVLF